MNKLNSTSRKCHDDDNCLILWAGLYERQQTTAVSNHNPGQYIISAHVDVRLYFSLFGIGSIVQFPTDSHPPEALWFIFYILYIQQRITHALVYLEYTWNSSRTDASRYLVTGMIFFAFKWNWSYKNTHKDTTGLRANIVLSSFFLCSFNSKHQRFICMSSSADTCFVARIQHIDHSSFVNTRQHYNNHVIVSAYIIVCYAHYITNILFTYCLP